ncbi:NAD(P)/FAD-dependent oxidoreductase [Inmirania thermothiophila]|uniref:Pyridine nucleotide-disulfide oxidoreductase n=1 Tax=Inmirania thermothiophila TaxID=1750597 RepID=A0A3N1Y4Q8_9GAMM|nr:FAD-dependent oxidoreductase [Inmirania thermothiophila]ROR32602.1 pyridine nucleotide-disulfide oxidoreductase [Inmirania thermothiophila]
MRHVIVGTGPAGVVAAETLRRLDPAAAITLIGREPGPPYARMALPYVLTGLIDERGTWLRKDPAHWDRLGIERLEDEAVALDPAARTLRLASGRTLDWDRLLLATGSTPVRPPIPGLEGERVVHCWTLDDARRIAAAARPGARVVLMGAGFIGCIIMEALATRGVQLTVVEMAPRMLARMMDDAGAEMIRAWCERKDITVLTGARVTAVAADGGGHPLQVHIDDRGTPRVLDADLLICATGVRPNTELVRDLADTDQGILVDEHLAASLPGVFAAGDVAQGRDFSTGGFSVHAIQPTAVEHGRVAARNMAGIETRYGGSLVMNVLDTLGLITASFGRWEGVEGGETAVLAEPGRFRYLKLQLAGDRLVGALAVGWTEHVGILRGLIQTRVGLGPWRDRLLRDPTRVAEAYVARTQAIAAP